MDNSYVDNYCEHFIIPIKKNGQIEMMCLKCGKTFTAKEITFVTHQVMTEEPLVSKHPRQLYQMAEEVMPSVVAELKKDADKVSRGELVIFIMKQFRELENSADRLQSELPDHRVTELQLDYKKGNRKRIAAIMLLNKDQYVKKKTVV